MRTEHGHGWKSGVMFLIARFGARFAGIFGATRQNEEETWLGIG